MDRRIHVEKEEVLLSKYVHTQSKFVSYSADLLGKSFEFQQSLPLSGAKTTQTDPNLHHLYSCEVHLRHPSAADSLYIKLLYKSAHIY
jgi:hypothetical protein